MRLALDTFLSAPARPGRFFIYTSGVWVLGPAPAPVDETAPLNPIEESAWRAPHEQRVLAAAGSDLRTVVVRPGIVYGGCRGIVGDLFKAAANGLVRVIGTGENHWPLVYDRDLGELYLMLTTSPIASGVFHANDECDERVNDLVTAIAGHVSIQPERQERAAARGAAEDGRRTPTRWPSIRSCEARAPVRSGGRPRSTPCPATPRGCSRSGAGGGKPRKNVAARADFSTSSGFVRDYFRLTPTLNTIIRRPSYAGRPAAAFCGLIR